MLYHAVALPFMSAVVYFFMDQYEVRPRFEEIAKWAIFTGAFTASISAMIFAYFLPNNWAFHGLFITGQAILFFGGMFFLFGVWPTKNFPSENEPNSDLKLLGVNFEYLNLSITTIAIMISATIAAYAASFFGQVDPNYQKATEEFGGIDPGVNENLNVFMPRLMERIVRREFNNAGYTFYEMIVTHLHIMLALLAAAVMLYAIRYADMDGMWNKIVQILYLPGVVILAIGAWLVITPWEQAHVVINVGAGFLLMVGVITAVYAWIKIAKTQLGDGYEQASLGQKILAMFKDPVRFALYFQLVWVDFVSAIPGIYVGINLEKFRSPEYIDVEYSFNVGHWHILATILAVMMLLVAIDYFKINDPWRKIGGWTALLGSIFAFAFATKYMLRTPGSDYEFDFVMIDIGLFLVFIAVFIVAFALLIDYLKGKLAPEAK